MTDAELIAKLKSLRSVELKIVSESLSLLNEVHRRRLDLSLGFSGLYDFAEKELGFEKDEAYRRIRAAEILRMAPTFEQHLRDGFVSMTSLQQASVAFRSEDLRRQRKKEPRLNDEEKRTVLNAILDKSSRSTARLLAETFPKVAKSEERVRELPDGRVIVSIELTREEYYDFLKLKGLLAHSNPENRSGFVVAKGIRAELAKVEKTDDRPLAAPRKGRYSLPPRTRRAVFQRAGWRCEYESEAGRRCESTHGLDTDHIVPLACGGTSELENLRCLCSKHNQFCAEEMGLRNPNKPRDPARPRTEH